MSEVKKIAHNTLVQIVGKAVAIAIGLLGFGMMTRYLGSDGYGIYATIFAYLVVFSIVVDLGMQMTTTKLISDPKNDTSTILSNALTIRLMLSLAFLSIAPLAALFFPYPPEVKAGIAIAAFGFLWGSMVATATSYFQKTLTMHLVAAAEVVGKIFFLFATVATISYDWGLFGMVAAVALDSFVIFLLLYIFAAQKISLRPAFNKEIWKNIFSTTWPIGLTIALNLIYFKGDIFIMSLTRSEAEVGLYAAPYRILEVLINLNYILLGLMLPLISGAFAVKNIERVRSITQSMFDFTALLSFPMIIGGFFVGRPLLELFAGQAFTVSGDIFKILLLATAAIFFASLFGYVIVALGKQKEMIKFYLLNAVISVALYMYFIPLYGYWAAAWLTVFTEVFILVTAAYVACKHLNFKPSLTTAVKSLFASIIMAGVLMMLGQINFITQIIAGLALYSGIILAIGGVDKNILKEIIKK